MYSLTGWLYTLSSSRDSGVRVVVGAGVVCAGRAQHSLSDEPLLPTLKHSHRYVTEYSTNVASQDDECVTKNMLRTVQGSTGAVETVN